MQAAVLGALMRLPASVQRRIVGRPVVSGGLTLAVDTQLMLWLMKAVRTPDPATLSIDDGRRLLRQQALLAGGSDHPVGSVRELSVAGRSSRLYVPTGAPDPGPLLVFFHGGGFVFGDIDSHDAPCRLIAEQGRVRVLSIDYSLAPEHPFPAAYVDAVSAFSWAVQNAAHLGADPSRIGVAGDSAGGNLAAEVALAAGSTCAYQILVYPLVFLDQSTPSRERFGDGFYLTTEFLNLAASAYLRDRTDSADRRHALMHATIPDETAPAYLVTAGFDPLRDEGKAYATRLEEAGTKVTHQQFDDQIHGFLNSAGALRSARGAIREITLFIRENL